MKRKIVCLLSVLVVALFLTAADEEKPFNGLNLNPLANADARQRTCHPYPVNP